MPQWRHMVCLAYTAGMQQANADKPGAVTPIFVLGLQRSGTTWVGNTLAEHTGVAGICADDHNGIHESIYFSHFAQRFDALDREEVRAAYIDYFTTSDYFLLSELEPAWLTHALETTRDHAQLFDQLMSAVAQQGAATHWVEKSPHHTVLAYELARALPQARFVCVTRSSQTLVRSRLNAYGRTPPGGLKRILAIARGVMANVFFTRWLRGFVQQEPRAVLVEYDRLLADKEGELARIAEFLSLDPSGFATEDRYAPNSSFASSDERARTFTAFDKGLVRMFGAVMAVLPLPLLTWIERTVRRRRGLEWPDWCWKRSGCTAPGSSV